MECNHREVGRPVSWCAAFERGPAEAFLTRPGGRRATDRLFAGWIQYPGEGKLDYRGLTQ